MSENPTKTADLRVIEGYGMKLRVDPNIPWDEVHFYHNGKRVGTITRVGSDDAPTTSEPV